MSFTKPQREYLGQMSRVLYGSESQWRKRYDRGEYDRIQASSAADKDKRAYVQLNNSKPGRRGTVLRLETAKSMGYAGEAPEAKDIQRTRPDFDGTVGVMEQHLHLQVLYAAKMQRPQLSSTVDAEERSRFLSAWLTARDGHCPIQLTLTGPKDEGYEEATKVLVGSLPESLRGFANQLLGRLNDNSTKSGLAFDAVLWLHDLTLCANHPLEAADLYVATVGIAPRVRPA